MVVTFHLQAQESSCVFIFHGAYELSLSPWPEVFPRCGVTAQCAERCCANALEKPAQVARFQAYFVRSLHFNTAEATKSFAALPAIVATRFHPKSSFFLYLSMEACTDRGSSNLQPACGRFCCKTVMMVRFLVFLHLCTLLHLIKERKVALKMQSI